MESCRRRRFADVIEDGDREFMASPVIFISAVRQKIHASDVLLVLIGPRWLTTADVEGRWRLADEQDLVRVEITTALALNIRVIPVLLQGASMPRAKDLPGELAALAHRNAVQIRDTHFDHDVDQLVDILGPTWRHRLGRLLMRWPVYAVASLLAAVLLGTCIYPHVALTPERARIQIGQMGLKYDANIFVERATNNDERAVALFLRAGMAPDARDREGYTAVDRAVSNGNLGLARMLVEEGGDVNGALLAPANRAPAAFPRR